jgi:hypothetical protein
MAWVAVRSRESLGDPAKLWGARSQLKQLEEAIQLPKLPEERNPLGRGLSNGAGQTTLRAQSLARAHVSGLIERFFRFMAGI